MKTQPLEMVRIAAQVTAACAVTLGTVVVLMLPVLTAL